MGTSELSPIRTRKRLLSESQITLTVKDSPTRAVPRSTTPPGMLKALEQTASMQRPSTPLTRRTPSGSRESEERDALTETRWSPVMFPGAPEPSLNLLRKTEAMTREGCATLEAQPD